MDIRIATIPMTFSFGSSPKCVGRKTRLMASKPLVFKGLLAFFSSQELGWILGGMTPVSDGIKEKPPMAFKIGGLIYPSLAVDLDVPWRVACQRTPTSRHK